MVILGIGIFSRLCLLSKELTQVQSKLCTQKKFHLLTLKCLSSNDLERGINYALFGYG